MATKKEPGKFDCYAKAKEDEPMFVLLGRDPDFSRLVNLWADRREEDVKCGNRPNEDMEVVGEARKCASDGQEWRKKNSDPKDQSKNKWRKS